MALPLTIDGVDFSGDVERNSYTVSYIKREGGNGGTMLDGSITVDILAFKTVITWDITALTSTKLSTLIDACLHDYVEVTYLDPLTNSTQTANFVVDVGTLDFAFQRHGIAYFNSGTTITFTQR